VKGSKQGIQRLAFNAPTSLVPSPHMSVVYPTARRVLRMTSFCSGDVRANTCAQDAEQLKLSHAKVC